MIPIVEFLLELSDMDDCTKPMRAKIRERIGREIEQLTNNAPRMQSRNSLEVCSVADASLSNQAPSMQRLMQNNPDLIPKPPVPVTPAAAQALAARQALMSQGEKPEAGRKSPRKI